MPCRLLSDIMLPDSKQDAACLYSSQFTLKKANALRTSPLARKYSAYAWQSKQIEVKSELFFLDSFVISMASRMPSLIDTDHRRFSHSSSRFGVQPAFCGRDRASLCGYRMRWSPYRAAFISNRFLNFDVHYVTLVGVLSNHTLHKPRKCGVPVSSPVSRRTKPPLSPILCRAVPECVVPMLNRTLLLWTLMQRIWPLEHCYLARC